RPRARVRPHPEPRHPRVHDRRGDRGRDLGDRQHRPALLLLRRRRGGPGPARNPRHTRRDPRPADRRRAAPARRLAPARVPRGRGGHPAHARPARPLARGGAPAEARETLEPGPLPTPLAVTPGAASLYTPAPLAALKGRGSAALSAPPPPIAERVRRLRAYD